MERFDSTVRTIKLKDMNLEATMIIVDDNIKSIGVIDALRGGGHPEQISVKLDNRTLSQVIKLLQHCEKIRDGEPI